MTRAEIKAAAEAMCNLNTYYAVIDLLEGGFLRGGTKESQKMIAMCKTAANKELKKYDAIVAKAEK